MRALLKVFTDNPTGLVMIIAAAAFLTGSFLVQGCKWEDTYRVQVPTQVAVATNSPPVVSLREAEMLMKQYADQANANIGLFAERIERGWQVGGMIMGLLNVGMPFLAATPIGAALVPLLTLGAGIMFKKPGTDKLTAAEKEKSYNKGLAVGEELLRRSLAASGIAIPNNLPSPNELKPT